MLFTWAVHGHIMLLSAGAGWLLFTLQVNAGAVPVANTFLYLWLCS